MVSYFLTSYFLTMICNICFKMLRGQVGRQWRGSWDPSFDHQPSLGSLQDSARSECFICRRILEDMPPGHRRSKHVSSRQKPTFIAAHIMALERGDYYRLEFTLHGDTHSQSSLGTLLLEPTKSSFESNVYTPTSTALNSTEVLQLARYWISKCMSDDHENCPNKDFSNRFIPPSKSSHQMEDDNPTGSGSRLLQKQASGADSLMSLNPPFYPTRLLILGPVDEPFVKLIVTKSADGQDSNCLTEPKGQYVTLSHCWGKTGQTFSLNEKNLGVFQSKGIPLKELPRTFRDAIHFARRLSQSVKYIWIDSLCIMQKNEADWLQESTQMYQVYRNSYCNISATFAEDSHHGLYANRDPQHLWGEEVNLNTKELVPSEFRVRSGGGSLDNHGARIQRCRIVDPSHWERKVEAAPVNTRAWVLQERLLAPRVIHFCEDQIAWECRELDASESSTDGIADVEVKFGEIRDRGRIRLKSLVAQEYGQQDSSSNFEDGAKQAQENWNLITEKFSKTNLTKPKDKLIALAGIAEQFYGKIAAPYVAGLWKTAYFASQLLWLVEPLYQKPKFFHPSRRPDVYRAPSFSWAAIDAPQGIRCGEIQEEEKLLIKVLRVSVQPEEHPNSQFGLVKKGGFIEIECQKLPIVISTKSRRTPEGVRDDVYIWTLVDGREKDARMHPNVYLDSPEDDFEHIRAQHQSSSTWLVPAYKNDSGDLIGLLLQQKSNNSPHFQRVGLSIIPRYISSEKEIMSEAWVDENGNFKSLEEEAIAKIVEKDVIQIF